MKAIHHIASHLKQNRAFYVILLINLLLTMITIIMAQSCLQLDSMIHDRIDYHTRSAEIVHRRINYQMISNPLSLNQIFAETDPDACYSEFFLCNTLFIPQANRNNTMISTASTPYPGNGNTDIKKIEFINKG